MRRAFLFVLDSFGIGGAADADKFGDAGANTLGNIAAACAAGAADGVSGTLHRQGTLHVPNLVQLGLARAAFLASGQAPAGLDMTVEPQGLWGASDEVSKGKDTPSGHWEIAGLPVPFEWGYFPRTIPAFPPDLIEAICQQESLTGILGNCHASGTDIIAQFGEEHLRSGKPIFYTSSDSVLQVAAHEEAFGLERLYQLCLSLRKLVDPLMIGRVIARPFTGNVSADFTRTGNRRDFAMPPPEKTLLDRVQQAGHDVYAIGKISDIFAGSGITKARKASGHDALFDCTLQAMQEAQDGDLVFTNFVDFDMLYGHRRDVAGYAAALEAFDRRLPAVYALMQEGDLLVLTADHGCDPTWAGSDHTRERVPVLVVGAGCGSIGVRSGFADIGATIAAHLGVAIGQYGNSFLPDNMK